MQEWDEAKARQDQQLESIETGLGHLKEIGAAMNDELQRHDILINEVGARHGTPGAVHAGGCGRPGGRPGRRPGARGQLSSGFTRKPTRWA